MKLKYTFIALVALISPLKGRAALQESQKKALYHFLTQTKNDLTIKRFNDFMSDFNINETDKRRMEAEMRLLSEEKSTPTPQDANSRIMDVLNEYFQDQGLENQPTPQDLVNVIMKTLLKDDAPLGKRTYSQYQGLENQPVPEWLDKDRDVEMLDLGSTFGKAKHLSKRDKKAKEKQDQVFIKSQEQGIRRNRDRLEEWAMDID